MTNDNCPDSGFAEIALGTRQTRPLQVTATLNGAFAGGNALVTGSSRITWRATGDVPAFRVTFYDLAGERAIWPFQEAPDGTDSLVPFLRVTRDGVARSLHSAASSEIKYEVAAEGAGDDVDPLDPMIIIRSVHAQA